MTYSVFLLPNTNLFYPQYVLEMIKNEPSSMIITLDKKYLFSMYPHIQFIERTDEEVLVSNSFIIEQIKNSHPEVVVLDDCFWDSNSELIDELITLHFIQKFHLINVLQLTTAKYSRDIAKLTIAEHIHTPVWIKHSYDKDLNFKLRFYNKEALNLKSEISIPIASKCLTYPI